MSDVPTGATGGDSVTGPNDGEYQVGIHAFDDADPYNYPYDRIGKDDKNRWFVQAYFDPYPETHNSFSFDSSWAEFKITAENNSNYTYFEQYEPTESMMDDGGSQEYPGVIADVFSIVSAYEPQLAVAQALISLAFSGGSGSVKEDPYDYVDWHIPLESGTGMPSSQDDSVGIRTDVANQADAVDPNLTNDITIGFESELGYYRYDGYGYDFFTTGVVSDSGYYWPTENNNY